MLVNSMASNPPEPSSSSGSPQQTVSEVVLSSEAEAHSYCEVDYVSETASVEEYQEHHFATQSESRTSPEINYQQTSTFDNETSGSTEQYVQVSLQSYISGNSVSTSRQNNYRESSDPEVSQEQFSDHINGEDKRQTNEQLSMSQHVPSDGHSPEVVSTESSCPPVSEASILSLQEESESHQSSQVEEEAAALQRVSLAVDPLSLQHVSVVQHGVSGLGLPVVLDRSSIAALMATSRADSSLALDTTGLSRSVISSQSLSQRSLLAADQSQFLAADTSIATIAHSLLSPILAQRDILPSIIASSSSSSSTSSHTIGTNFPINHKQMLAQKYAAELETPSTSSNLVSDVREQHLIESINERASSPYVVASSGGTLIDSHPMAVYSDHPSSLPTTSVSQCLPIDVYAIDRGVALVSSTRDSPEDLMEADVQFTSSVTHSSSHPVQNFVSSSVDLVSTHHMDHGMHCAVDSTVGPKMHSNDENIVDSSGGYSHHVDTSPDEVLHTTTRGQYGRHLSDLNSCDEGTTSNAVTSVLNDPTTLEANEALSSSTSHVFSTHGHLTGALVVHENIDDIQGCPTVSSATHPDSTRSPVGLGEHAQVSVLAPGLHTTSSTDISHSEYSRPKRDLRSSRHWCEDCGLFYEKECPHHRIQLIFDKPVLSRAWASLPATYLYVNKIGIDEDGEPAYGVFAKKTIPKRTQFGPIEGVLVKREDPPSERFILLVEHEDGIALYLDTSDESMSNWMRFVRPADTHKEQNLVLVQQGPSLFFNTTRSINPKTELRVWYSAAYAEKWGLPILEPDEEERKALQEQENAWPCFECNQRFATSEDLQKHLNQHDEENDSVLDTGGPRTRNRTKTRGKLTKKGHSSRLRVALESLTETTRENLSRKPRGRPPKKYKVTLETLEEATTQALPPSKRPRGRPPKKYKITSKQDDYKCEICHKVFPRNYSLQRHLIMHSGEKKYKCPICEMKFSHVYNRNRHVRRHKQREEDELLNTKPVKSLFKRKQGAEWICTHCDLTFDNSSVLNLHTLTHAAEDVGLSESIHFVEGRLMTEDGFEGGSDENSKHEDDLHKCPECTQEFLSRRELIEHASVHGKIVKQRCYRGIINPLKPFKCNLCYKSFASDERLIRHYLVHGSEDSKPLQCDICFKRFLNNSALACHIKVHSEERKFYECPICKKEFDQIVALKEHVHVHCDNGVYSCPTCQKIFEEYNQIRKHIRAFHSERRYPCDKCDKVFPRPDKLKLHMLRHSDHREFLCANCGKQFKRKDKLKEHMKRMHAPEREAKINAKNSKSSGSKKFVPKVSPTDYHRFIYKCHTCLLGFKRRGMLVNHLAKRHPDIRPESVPELNLPILKTTRDYYCQYCEKVYKSSSKRKAHILKNHPGAELPMSNRRKGGIPEIPGMPNPTFSQTVGSITTHPHHCSWCHKQYASKAKLLQHQRKKHMDMLALSYVTSSAKVQAVCDQAAQVTGQIVIAQSVGANLPHDAAAVVIDASKRKIHYVDRDALVVASHPEGIPTADLLTQAMSELTQTLTEYRSSSGEFLTARLTHSTPPTLVNTSPNSTPVSTPPSPTTAPTPTPNTAAVSSQATISASAIDQVQLNQLLAQYQQPLSPQSLAAVVVTSVSSRSWPSAVTTTLSNYPAR